MRRYYQGIKRAAASAAEGQGALSAVKKTLRVYKKEGLNGVVRRLNVFCRINDNRRTNRPKVKKDFAFEIPFQCPVNRNENIRVCAIVHIYYLDLAAEIKRYLENVPGGLDVYISTVSEDGRRHISEIFSSFHKGDVQIRIFPNRGRDIAAKLVGFSDVYEKYDYVLSLHTKKSLHGGHSLSLWRKYLYENMLGSPAIVSSIFSLLEKDRVGLIFPQHFFYLHDILKWDANFEPVCELLEKMDVYIDDKTVLEFPSGSMFWCRAEAMRSLLKLGLTFEDFPEETGQIDGTLAHAIERLFLYAVESQGYTWAKVVRRDLYPLSSTLIPVAGEGDLQRGMSMVYRPLLQSSGPSQ